MLKMPEIDRSEVYRYLGYRGKEADETTVRLTEQCIEELLTVAEPKMVVKEYPLEVFMDGTIDCGCFQTKSETLLKNLGGCGRVLLMAMTLGLEVDRLLHRYGKVRISKAVILQAASSALVEAYCNELCCSWAEEYEASGLYLRPRYSPGYGDFSLDCQEKILDGLDAGRKLGITLTDGGMMVPTKSVTAVIGISREKIGCQIEGCKVCTSMTCRYRRT